MFGKSRQGVYQAEARTIERQIALSQIKPMVQEIRMSMPRVGTRKLYHLLKQKFISAGLKIGRDGLNAYLRSQQMLIKPKKNYVKTTNSSHWLRKHPNLLKDQKPNRAEQYFVSDITYIKSKQKVHYLSLVTDAYTRKIMGYQLSDDMRSKNVIKALQMAIRGRLTDKQLIHHSDRGLQYCSSKYQAVLKVNKIKPSMTDGYDCYQNALAERINGILKSEFLINKCNNKKELKLMVSESIDTYNKLRPHLSLGMKTPNETHKKACKAGFTGLNLLT